MDKKFLGIGAAYYPELWDKEEIQKDILRCKELGINILRIGEFAWQFMEPKEGEFDFSWLECAVDKLYEAGISTVLCTPTCTPPRWLLNKYEETRSVETDGTRSEVSSRCHPCKTSPIMRKKNRVVVTQLVKTFQGKKGVIGWQIDNEFFYYGNGCYCSLCKSAFRDYLKKRYKSIDKLNNAWGMHRWSLAYEDFDSIDAPYPKQWTHPSLGKAWRDFQCKQIISYSNEQAEVLHAYSDLPVGTDMMMRNELSYYDINEKLDVVQLNHYEPASGLKDTAFCYDFLRPIKEMPFWVTETQVGWNGGIIADGGYRPKGNCYVNTMFPFIKGGAMNLYWHFRAHPNGHEIGHGALFSAAGRAYRVSEEVACASRDLQRCKDFLTNSKVQSKIALHYSSTAKNSFDFAPIIKDMEYRSTILHKYYAAFCHYNIDVIDTPHSVAEYDVVLSPFLSTLEEHGIKERMLEFVQKGGTWIVGPMSDIMTADLRRYTDAPYSFLEELIGVYTKYQKPIDNTVFAARWWDGAACEVRDTFDAYELKEGTEALASYDGGEFNGLAVVAERKIGKGKVVLVGSVLSYADLRKLIGIGPIAQASENITLTERFGIRCGIVAVETENKEGYICLNGEYKEILSDRILTGKVGIAPYEVLILECIEKFIQ